MQNKRKNNKTILAVAAHPDDVDFGAAGTIAKWVVEGYEAYYLICTRGCKGSADPKMTTGQLAKIRKKEQEEAAKVIGVKKVFFLEHTDGELEPTLTLKEEISKIIRKTKPDTVITFDPAMRYSISRGYINHPDHIAAGEATLSAVFPLARDRLNFPDHERLGLWSHKVSEVLLFNFDEANFFVDITNTFDKKLAALKCHPSQIGDFGRVKKMVTEWAETTGKRAKCKYAEGFKRLLIN